MANIAKLIGEVVKRAKLDTKTLETINAAIQDESLSAIEVSDSDVDAVLGGLHNLDTARELLKPEITNTIRAEVLNGAETGLIDILRSFLTEEEIEAVNAEDKLHKKQKKAIELLNAKKPADGSENARKVESLTRALEDANAKIRAKDAEFETKLNETIAQHKVVLFNQSLETRILSRLDIAKEKKEDRHFKANFFADYSEFLKNNKLKIDAESAEVLNEDDTPYYNKRNEKVSLDDLLGSVVKEYKYEKKSETPERGRFEVEGGETKVEKLNEDLW